MKKIGKIQINRDRILGNDELIKMKGGAGNFTCLVDCDGTQSWINFYTQNCDPYDVFCADLICDDWHDPYCDDPHPCSCTMGY